jgi:hypothetical protein
VIAVDQRYVPRGISYPIRHMLNGGDNGDACGCGRRYSGLLPSSTANGLALTSTTSLVQTDDSQ